MAIRNRGGYRDEGPLARNWTSFQVAMCPVGAGGLVWAGMEQAQALLDPSPAQTPAGLHTCVGPSIMPLGFHFHTYKMG